MKVTRHKIVRDGKQDRVRMKVQFTGDEWGLILMGAVSGSLGWIRPAASAGLVSGALEIAIIAYIFLGFFVLLIWLVATRIVIFRARKKGTIMMGESPDA